MFLLFQSEQQLGFSEHVHVPVRCLNWPLSERKPTKWPHSKIWFQQICIYLFFIVIVTHFVMWCLHSWLSFECRRVDSEQSDLECRGVLVEVTSHVPPSTCLYCLTIQYYHNIKIIIHSYYYVIIAIYSIYIVSFHFLCPQGPGALSVGSVRFSPGTLPSSHTLMWYEMETPVWPLVWVRIVVFSLCMWPCDKLVTGQGWTHAFAWSQLG